MKPQGSIILSSCNTCSRDTEHDVVHVEVLEEIVFPDFDVVKRSAAVRCRGCKDLALREEQWHFDKVPDADANTGSTLQELVYRPPRLWRKAPEWLSQLELVDAGLSDILSELYLAANDGQPRLLSIGVRTALDYVMTQIVSDVGGFDKKLQAMVTAGHLSTKQKEILETVIDAGSATVHRGFKPNKPLLQEMLITMESIVRDHYLTGPMLKSLRATVPPRPPRTAP